MLGKESATQLPASQLQLTGGVRHQDTCVILHLYYPNMWNEMQSYLSNLEHQFDLYVTIPHKVVISEDEIKVMFPNAYIYRCENRGRDIAPFWTVFSAISKLEYNYICKVHTKKSPHIINGKEWFQDMLNKLLGSREVISKIKKAFDSHPDWGMIAPSGYVVPSNYFWSQNAINVNKLAHAFNIPFDGGFSFVAGSMFWFKPQAFQLLQKVIIPLEDFEPERGQQDGTLAHAFERLFGMVLFHTDYKIAESDAQEVRLADVSFHFRLLAQEFQKQEHEIQVLKKQILRNERRLKKLVGGKLWQLIGTYRRLRSFKSVL